MDAIMKTLIIYGIVAQWNFITSETNKVIQVVQ